MHSGTSHSNLQCIFKFLRLGTCQKLAGGEGGGNFKLGVKFANPPLDLGLKYHDPPPLL